MGKNIHIFCKNLEDSALKQFKHCCDQEFVIEAALMPDAHTGYVAPIGAVLKTSKAVVPAWVGYDIGCGMIAVQISTRKDDQRLIQEQAQKIFNQVRNDIPMGAGRHNTPKNQVYLVDDMEKELKTVKESTTYKGLFKEVEKRSRPNLGTVGSGNHFIEILVWNDETWLVIHSGSRGVGHYIGTFFMKAVSGKQKGFENTFAIKDPTDKMHSEYMLYQQYCLAYALLNRLSMALKVEKAIKTITGITYNTMDNLWTNKNHNHCIKIGPDLFLHRKGATSSDKGERGVIPANMRDGSYLVEGLGNKDFLNSSSHGAGRQMSRREARDNVKLDSFKETMEGIVAPVTNRTIDESPFAYKDITEVMEAQKESVKIIKHLKPIINWKGY